jgi:putative nucleotidyltransferase with HDIG domain
LISPLARRAAGQVSAQELGRLANFEHPLLRRLSSRAPGTWAHSLNMANIAEMAANAIGADGQLVRVGAYYHDLGKSAEPNYFIENQTGKNPHDEMRPEASADAIFGHVDSGVQLARKHGVPEAVVEFIYTHHATDRLEYFWHKNVKAGNKAGLGERDFCYRGMPPLSRETGILAICDAVEAASRTLEDPDVDGIRKLVRQIIFTKLEKGILDESGLSIADLRKIADSMVESVRSAMHGRVKYPWQEREEREGRQEREEAASAREEPKERAPVTAPRPQAKPSEGTPVITPIEESPEPRKRRPRPALRAKPTGAHEPAWVDSPELDLDGESLSADGPRERVATKPLGSRDE